MKENASHAAMQRISKQRSSLTPKGKVLADYIVQNPRKAVFMTTKELAENCAVSEATVVRFVGHLKEAPSVYVIGSRLSYTYAYYLGWSLTKVRKDIRILKGSDSTAIDWLAIAPPESLVVIIATSRYPNELIKLGKVVRRHGQQLVTITDSTLCPLNHFAHLALVAPSKHIPFIGSPSTISCIINFLVMELARMDETWMTEHHEKLEQTYRENDILFNIEGQDFNGV